MVRVVYCDRSGCGKVVGAQRIDDNGKIVEAEWVEGHCTEDVVDDNMNIITTRHFCSIECSNKADEFVTPEDIEDDSCD